jgi:hypothetical protein
LRRRAPRGQSGTNELRFAVFWTLEGLASNSSQDSGGSANNGSARR